MTAAEVKARLAELLEFSKKDAENVLWAFQELCNEAIKKGDVVPLPGIGKLSCIVRPARKARNPRTGESVKVPAKVAVKFSLSKQLKEQAPNLKGKVGKALLAEAEEKQEAREKAKRKRERAAEKEAETKSKKKKKKDKEGKVSKKSKSSTTKSEDKKKKKKKS
jgi:DNA-binding protein HU-beta